MSTALPRQTDLLGRLADLPPEEILFLLDKELAERDFSEFFKQAWHVVEPGRPLVWGWHLQAKCDHAQAVYNFTVPPEIDPEAKSHTGIQDLIVNEPPRCSKSLTYSVMFNAWVWTRWPGARFLCVTYADDLASRDALKTRQLIESEWYQARWPLKVSDEKRGTSRFNIQTFDEKTGKWKNTGGFRVSTTILGIATGEGADFRCLDDPHNVKKSLSDTERKQAITFINLTLPTRVVDPERSATILTMQRLHKQDATGHMLSKENPPDLLCFPMEYEKERVNKNGQVEGGNRCRTKLGFVDPRKEDGELLHPERWSRIATDKVKSELRMQFGDFGVNSQLQQRPTSLGGGMFQPDKLVMVNSWPPAGDLDRIVRYWDRAGSQEAGCYSSGALMAIRKSTQRTIILEVTRGQWNPDIREREIRDTAFRDVRRLGISQSSSKLSIVIEGEPGSDGAHWTVRNLAGFNVKARNKRESKEADWAPLASQVNAGGVEMVIGPWNKESIQEMEDAPFSTFKDDLDSMSGAFREIHLGARIGAF